MSMMRIASESTRLGCMDTFSAPGTYTCRGPHHFQGPKNVLRILDIFLDQGLADYFCQEPASEYFRLCMPCAIGANDGIVA